MFFFRKGAGDPLVMYPISLPESSKIL